MYYVYILTNKHNTTFYIGVTNSLSRRIFEHQQKVVSGFSEKYNLTKLVHVEQFNNAKESITREKQLKNWHRNWKLNLIKQNNPLLEDLSGQIT